MACILRSGARRCITAPHQLRSFSLLSGLLDTLRGDTEPVNVVFADPRTVLSSAQENAGDLLTGSGGVSTCMTVPGPFVRSMAQGLLELGDMDEPMNNWYFGQKEEIMKYNLKGTVQTQSGYVSIIREDILKSIMARQDPKLPSWEEFKASFDKGAIKFSAHSTPFVFVGRMVDTSLAAVYELKKDKELVGVLISSEAA